MVVLFSFSFCISFKHRPEYFICTIRNIGKGFRQLDEVTSTEFIPATTGRITCSDLEQFFIPPKLGELEIPMFSEIAKREQICHFLNQHPQ